MARKKKDGIEAAAYIHDEAKRLNNPEAGNIDRVPKVAERRKTYNWDPREAPQLVWSGKAGLKMSEVKEEMSFEVPLVNLHIHERVAPEAILRAAKREDAQRSLFADPVMDFNREVQFYQHQVDWSNRLILGDSLQVMSSLLEREGMRGKVQMIYLDPPYGIKFGSNFQPRIDKRDVKDGADDDLTREVEQVQAFRDTWELGVHSYLSYLRGRLILARELLTNSGSIFVQIGDENVHRVRCLMDEVFGDKNSILQIAVQKTGSVVGNFIQGNCDYVIWYAKDREEASKAYRQLYLKRGSGSIGVGGTGYTMVDLPNGLTRKLTASEQSDPTLLPPQARIWSADPLTSDGFRPTTTLEFGFEGRSFHPGSQRHWGVTVEELERAGKAGRIVAQDQQVRQRKYFDDYPVIPLSSIWDDVGGASDRQYVVQTSPKVIERCMLMTTDPGDLVLDPTCGSGTTAYVAEQWGRRWITCDTSRVAVAISRHRMMTAPFDYYKLRFTSAGIAGGFRYKTVPHITLKTIGQNGEIDIIAAEFQSQIDQARVSLNRYLGLNWKEWEVQQTGNDFLHRPSDPAPDYKSQGEEIFSSETANRLLDVFWSLKREMLKRIDASIQRNAPQEELVDNPEKEPGIVRVSGPFTVEAVPNVSELSVEVEEKIFGDDLQMQIFEPVQPNLDAKNVSAYLSDMIEKLRKVGVVTKGKGRLSFSGLRPMDHEIVHAEGDIDGGSEGQGVRCAVIFGPQNGAVSEIVVREGLDATRRYDAVLFCGYDFTSPAQERLHAPVVGQQVFMAYINPDTAMTDLLKDTKASQIFTMVGEPDVVVYRFGDPTLKELAADAENRGAAEVAKRLTSMKEGEVFLELRGVDLYNPLKGEVISDSGADVHAIFVDHDYDGKSFCICQALFPNKKDSWEKIERSLKGTLDTDAFEAFRTQVTLPFKPGENGRVQIKVYDTRGNAVVKTIRV